MIHRYQLGGHRIVLDVCSGAVHLVDELASDMIGLFEELPREKLLAAMAERHPETDAAELTDCCAQIEALKESGQLFTPDRFEPLAGELKSRSAGVVKALCLHVAHTCNLNCSYCFASQGKYHGERAIMSFEVGKQKTAYEIGRAHV